MKITTIQIKVTEEDDEGTTTVEVVDAGAHHPVIMAIAGKALLSSVPQSVRDILDEEAPTASRTDVQ